jgi:drug/metabolite transporter (DMT)-like permease
MDRQRLLGFALTIISAVAYGAMPILARFAYQAKADPITVLFLRFSIAALIMLAILAWRRVALPRGRTLRQLMLLGVTCYVGQAICYFTALTLASASLVALLLYLYPVLVTIFSVTVFRERLTRAKGLALALALSGAVLIVGLGGGGQPLGIALGVGAAVIYSVAILAGSRLLQSAPALPAATVIMASAGLAFGVIVALRGPAWPVTPAGWLATLALAVVAGVIAIGAFLAGLERIGPTNAATLSTLEPVVAVGLAAALLGERLTSLNALGGGLILAAVILLARGELGRAPQVGVGHEKQSAQ